MYVIFPLDDLLDLNSARGNKRGKTTKVELKSPTSPTGEVLPLSQPNQKLPNQNKPPLNQPQTNPQAPPRAPKQSTVTKPPTPTQQIKPQSTPQSQPTPKISQTQPTTKQPQPQSPQKTPSQPSQQQNLKPLPQIQKPLSRAPSKVSISATSAIVGGGVPPQLPISVHGSTQPTSGSPVKKPLPNQQSQQPRQLPPDQVNKLKRPSLTGSTETTSTSSTGASKGKGSVSHPPTATTSSSPVGGAAATAGRPSWEGATGVCLESCPTRSGTFKACKDLKVIGSKTNLAVIDLTQAESSPDIRGSIGNLSVKKPPIAKSNSFRSHLSESVSLPRPKSIPEGSKKGGAGVAGVHHSRPPTPTQPASPTTESPPKNPEVAVKQATSLRPESKPVAIKQDPHIITAEKHKKRVESVKIKQELPLQAAPSIPSAQKITTAESIRIQQECLAPGGSESRPHTPNQRHSSGGRSNRNLGAGTTAVAAAPGANSKKPGSVGSPRGGPTKGNTVTMASNEPGLRDLTNPAVNETLKQHNAFTFKLVKTGPSSGALEGSRPTDENLSSITHHHSPHHPHPKLHHHS